MYLGCASSVVGGVATYPPGPSCQPDNLTFMRKARGLEAHKGGQLVCAEPPCPLGVPLAPARRRRGAARGPAGRLPRDVARGRARHERVRDGVLLPGLSDDRGRRGEPVTRLRLGLAACVVLTALAPVARADEADGGYARVWIGVSRRAGPVDLPAADGVCKLLAKRAARERRGLRLHEPRTAATTLARDSPPRTTRCSDSGAGAGRACDGSLRLGDVRVMAPFDYVSPSLLLGARAGFVLDVLHPARPQGSDGLSASGRSSTSRRARRTLRRPPARPRGLRADGVLRPSAPPRSTATRRRP